MPIVREEPALYPEGLFDLDAAAHPWHVAHVKSRCEKSLARHLFQSSSPYYLPQLKKVTARSGRNFVSHLPLLQGYVFLRGSAQVCSEARRSGVIVNLLPVRDQGQLHEELRQIHDLLARGISLRVESSFSLGDHVLIKSGAFEGYRGIIIQEGRGSRLLVNITMLRKQVSVEFDPMVLGPDRAGLHSRAHRKDHYR